MKFTVVLIAALSVSASFAIKVKKSDELKDKREAPVGYPSHSSHSYQSPSHGQEEASAISVGAGYSVGGNKPSYSLEGSNGGAQYQFSPENLQSSGHGAIQLSPISLHSGQGYASSDLSQLMAQLSHGLNSGALSLQSGDYQQAGHGGAQELSLPQYSYGSPKQQQYAIAEQPSIPSYAAGTKGLGSYSTGPVLFSPSDSTNGQVPTYSYGAPSSGHSLGGASGSAQTYINIPSSGHSLAGLSGNGLSGHSFGEGAYALGGSGHSLGGLSLGGAGHSFDGAGLSLGGAGHSLGGAGLSLGGSGHSLGGSGHSLGGSGHSLGGSGHSLGGSGHSLGGSGHSLGGSGHSLGGAGNLFGGAGHSFGGGLHSFGGLVKGLSHSYRNPPKNSFKPSAFLGSSVQGESGHGLSSLSGSYNAPSFGSYSDGGHEGLSLSSASHGGSTGGSFGGFGGGSAKFVGPSYVPPKSSGFGSSLESVASFSSDGHSASPPGTTYGHPSAAHAASSSSPQYYVPSKSTYPSFGGSSSSYRGPSSGHGSISSFSSGPKHSFSGHSGPSSRYGLPKDIQGAHSETSYNTIKYSEELKSHAH